MKFSWWWVVIAVVGVWVTGWLVTVIVAVFFNPLDSARDKKENFKDRLLAQAIMNWFLWPFFLPPLLERRKLLRDMKTGKRPNWIMLADGEESGRVWKLSDGTVFEGSASTAGESKDPANIWGDYEDRSLAGDVDYRIRRLAPTAQPPGEWTRMKFWPKGAPDQVEEDDEEEEIEEDDDDEGGAPRYDVSVKLERGKYLVEFRVPNRSGQPEELPGLTLIVSDFEDYNL